jgi:hypothetical protein
VALVTASRGLNAAVLLTADAPQRFDRLAVVAPYMRLEPEPAPPDPEWLEALLADGPGFIVPFMHGVFTEPDSAGPWRAPSASTTAGRTDRRPLAGMAGYDTLPPAIGGRDPRGIGVSRRSSAARADNKN